MPYDYDIAAYYFPNFHVDPRNEAAHGPGWTEWELVRAATPRFEGHAQPLVPRWGYEDEADPAVMAKKAAAARDHGVSQFIFDWYWYDDGPYLNRAIEEGFMPAVGGEGPGFALMWANHDWLNIHPAKLREQPRVLYPGAVRPDTFDHMTDQIIERYFGHPGYWRIEGRPYFSIYALRPLVEGFGGLEGTARAVRRFREKVQAAGFPGLHLNAIVWGRSVLPGEREVQDLNGTLDAIECDSITSYVWVHHIELPEFPMTDYGWVMDRVLEKWPQIARAHRPVYYPNVTVGWDSSPRTCQTDRFVNWQYPFSPGISGNTPERFREALDAAKAFVADRPPAQRVVTVNAWNEWTEGSYLEPDEQTGTARLEMIREVFGPTAATSPPT